MELPEYVPAIDTVPSFAKSMIARRPPTAATGKPPPQPLAMTVRSGNTPSFSWPPPNATRKPVMTSSKMSTAP
jgi:hypothetical protein